MLRSKKIYQILPDIIVYTMIMLIVLCCSDVAWAADDSVIDKIKVRAIEVIEHYKPIVYILGGFGLACVAWGAIFGKMNWKWFGSLAISLFIVAWMGHLIDYFTRDRGYNREDAVQKAFSGTTLTSGFRSAFKDTIEGPPRDDSGKFVSLIIRGTNEYPGDFGDTLTMSGTSFNDPQDDEEEGQ